MAEVEQQAGSAARWIAEIETAETNKDYRRWHKRSKKIIDRYLDISTEIENELSRSQQRGFNILWSNVETLLPALYGRQPIPDVSRRFRDQNQVAAAAATVLERATSFCLDDYDFNGTIKAALKDYALLGRGQVRVRYEPTFEPDIEATSEIEGPEYAKEEAGESVSQEGEPEEEDDSEDESGDEEIPERLAYEQVRCEYVHWQDFLHSPARTWPEVRWVAFRVFMTRTELVERFGDIGRKVPLVAQQSKDQYSFGNGAEGGTVVEKAEVWELWSKDEDRVFWLSKSMEEPLDQSEPPLRFNDFFPCPRPLYGTLANVSLMPTPDYVQYQDQAYELDDITSRLRYLTDAIRVVGAYDAKFAKLADILDQPDNKLLPVEMWDAMRQQGGLKAAVDFLPIDQNVVAFQALAQARDTVKTEIYELTGISDLLRGDSDPRTTAEAERIKGFYGSLRLRDRQEEVARFIRDILRLKAEVIAEAFSQESLAQMTGVELLTAEQKQLVQAFQQAAQANPNLQPPPGIDIQKIAQLLQQPSWDEVIALLRNDRLRSFNIDIETDSTLTADRQRELGELNSFVEQIGQVLRQAAEAVQTAPEIAAIGLEVVSEMVSRFKLPRALEGQIRPSIEALKQRLSQPPQADTNAAAQAAQQQQQQAELEQAQIQAELAKAQATQATAQAAQIRAQAEIQVAQIESQSKTIEAQVNQQRLLLEAQKLQLEAKNQELESRKIELQFAQLPIQAAEVQIGGRTNL